MLKIVHAADIHAGRPASRELDREKASVRRREIETGLSRIADLCKREKADLLLLSGDLFEHSHVRATWAREAREVFRSLDQTRVFISPGNHDPLVRDSLYKTAAWPENVTVFEGDGFGEVVLQDLNTVVHGLGWRTYLEHRRLLKGFHRVREGSFNILVIHGDVVWNPAASDNGSQYLPIHPEDLEGSGMDYAALGHIHAPGQFHVGQVTAVYPGCPEPLDFGDKGQRGVYLVSVDERAGQAGFSVSAEFVPMALREMRTVDLDITGLDTVERVRNAVLSVGDRSSRKRDLWAIRLAGVVEPEIVFDTFELERLLGDDFFFLRLIPDYSPGYDLGALSDPKNASLEGRFARHLMSLRDDLAIKGEERSARIAELALQYGLDALRQGKVILRRGRQG
jgi:exonuclease SbcD